MKIITQFKNWLLNITGHKNSPMITVFICIIILLMLISHGKSKEIKKLKKEIYNQELCIKEVYKKTNYEHVDSLYMEIMDLGSKLDSMIIKYD
tara:strand:+ start:87 stop:365 length:279 start_codon:yes stop_codon:yes gene_type:complete